MDEYRSYNERPTLLWVAIIMTISVFSLIAGVFLNASIVFSMVMFAIGITAASIGSTVFVIAVIYPAIVDKFSKPRKYEDE